MLTRARRSRTEQGAVAVLVAILAVLLFGVAALAVDLGQVYTKKTQVQSAADLAAMGAADTYATTGDKVAATQTAYELLLDNGYPADMAWEPTKCGSPPNRGVPHGCVLFDGNTVQVWAPPFRVDYAFAPVLGALTGDDLDDRADVTAMAAATIASPAGRTPPVWVASGCDYGVQRFSGPPGGSAADPSDLPFSSPDDSALHPGALLPNELQVGQDTVLDISSTDGSLKDVDAVAFSTSAGAHVVVHAAPDEPPADEPPTGPTVVPIDDNNVEVTGIPDAVTANRGVWWVRVSADHGDGDTDDVWSPVNQALALVVGDQDLECDANSYAFGSITYPTGNALDTLTPDDSVNAVQGGSPSALTERLITGPDALLNADTTPGCAPDGGSDRATIVVDGSEHAINDDTLTCFLPSFEDADPPGPDHEGQHSDGEVDVDDVSTPGDYSGRQISAKIFESPRFFWIPVVSGPAAGPVEVAGFRPAFLTGEIGESTASHKDFDGETVNGLKTENGQLTVLKLVLLNPNALPDTASGAEHTRPFVGDGTRVPMLVK